MAKQAAPAEEESEEESDEEVGADAEWEEEEDACILSLVVLVHVPLISIPEEQGLDRL